MNVTSFVHSKDIDTIHVVGNRIDPPDDGLLIGIIMKDKSDVAARIHLIYSGGRI